MKNIYKTLGIIIPLVIIVFGCSCETVNIKTEGTETIIKGAQIEVYTIDSCEYIGSVVGSNRDIFSHKGNCKFCAIRNKNK